MITIANLLEYLKIIAPAWVTGTEYAEGDNVTNSSVVYVCDVAHTASPAFATDILNWRALSILTTAVNHGISFVEEGTNKDWEGTTEYFTGNGASIYIAKNVVTTVTTIKYFDEDTDSWLTIFDSPDVIADSVQVNGVDWAVTLYNGYTFESGKKYQLIYTNGSAIPQILKTVALEQAARYFYDSPEGNSWFSKTSENMGSQASSSVGIESKDAMNARHDLIITPFRIMNI